jgi:hypothetical protein
LLIENNNGSYFLLQAAMIEREAAAKQREREVARLRMLQERMHDVRMQQDEERAKKYQVRGGCQAGCLVCC